MQSFLSTLSALREAAGDMSVCRLLWHLYNTLDLLGIFGAMDEGTARQENLIALTRHAECFESSGYRGLLAFIPQLRRLMEAGEAPEVKISIAPENSYLIETRIIDGRKYLLIPADEGVEVNGIGVCIRE